MTRSILTVIDAASNYDLVTLEQVKEELNITGSDQDEILTTRIHRASEAINNYCNRIFIQETVSEVFRNGWDWNKNLFLRRTPINTITNIVVGISPNTETVDSTLYEFDPNDGIGGFIYPLDSNGERVLFPISWSSWGSWSCGNLITVTYSGGYLLANVPYMVQEACLELIKIRQNLASGSGISTDRTRIEIPGVWLKQVDTTTADTNNFFPNTIKDMLAPFKKIAFPS